MFVGSFCLRLSIKISLFPLLLPTGFSFRKIWWGGQNSPPLGVSSGGGISPIFGRGESAILQIYMVKTLNMTYICYGKVLYNDIEFKERQFLKNLLCKCQCLAQIITLEFKPRAFLSRQCARFFSPFLTV